MSTRPQLDGRSMLRHTFALHHSYTGAFLYTASAGGVAAPLSEDSRQLQSPRLCNGLHAQRPLAIFHLGLGKPLRRKILRKTLAL